MQRYGALAIFAIAASVATAHDVSVEEEMPMLGEDDACLAESGDKGSGLCALSALQLRAQKQQEEQRAQKVESGIEDDAPLRNASLLEGSAAFDTAAMCFSYTGGTCVSEACASRRHATCAAGKCVCANGCAGADGACYSSSNTLIAQSVLFRNRKWHHYKMYFQAVSTFGQMKTTAASSWMNLGQDKFAIYRVPGKSPGLNQHSEYFLASEKWKDYVVGIKATTGTALSPFGAYAVDLAKKGGIFDAWGPSNIMLRICETASGGVQIGAKMLDQKTIWAYIHHASWYVYGSVSPPGEGGTWDMEPSMPRGTFEPCL